MAGSNEMVEIYTSSFFQFSGLEDNYIRIQVFTTHLPFRMKLQVVGYNCSCVFDSAKFMINEVTMLE
jgi:predicted acetyltransferase